MFDISTDDISRLDDTQLRELVARLASAEVQGLGHSPLTVTWGGSQTAPDGGLDVFVDVPAAALPSASALPRPRTGFQVKKEDMPPSKIKAEIRPGDALRPVLADLASGHGAYIIVSSSGSTAYQALEARRRAMRSALHDCPDAHQLHIDFFDRTRLADWVRLHPGLVLWVREQVGRALDGWRSYGAWSNPAEPVDAPYLVDDRLRVHVGARGAEGIRVVEALDRLRALLVQPRVAVRLVGLSGVGKTRLMQALFDDRVGSNALACAEAVYTDLANNPTPQPASLATDLIAHRRRAILIVDNCGAALHRELAQICAQAGSRVSLITVEYDVREDIPEDTEVVTMDTASPALVQQLVSRRYPKLTLAATQTIASAADGNARIALAIAGTVRHTDDLTRLSSSDLFARLFWQRHQEDKDLLRAAQACALVYSFDFEAEDGVEAELSRLGSLVGQDVGAMHSAVVELERRELVQRRAKWRAVLPHALANYLASRALDDIPVAQIREHIIDSGNFRLLRSFTRRLSYLHSHPVAKDLCTGWLQPDGMLGNITEMDFRDEELFANVASVVPSAALEALERVASVEPDSTFLIGRRQCQVVRAIAHDAKLFDRCVALLLWPVERANRLEEVLDVQDALVTFFQLFRSGTHASASRRFALIAKWLASTMSVLNDLGRLALQRAFTTTGFSSKFGNAFGARLLDDGYRPLNNAQAAEWYTHGLRLLDQLFMRGGADKDFACEVLGKRFAPLWALPALHDDLETLMLRFAAGRFWLGGWIACRQAVNQYRDGAGPAGDLRLNALCGKLAPTDLASKTLAAVTQGYIRPYHDKLPDESFDHYQLRIQQECEALGAEVAEQPAVLAVLAPQLHQVGGKAELFGRGLGAVAHDLSGTWHALVKAWAAVPSDRQNPALLRGFVAGLAQRDAPLAQECLDECLTSLPLAPALAALNATVGWDERGLERLALALGTDQIAVEECRYLYGAVSSPPAVCERAASLVADLAARPGGFPVALDILMRWLEATQPGNDKRIELLRPTCRAVLAHGSIGVRHSDIDHEMACIAKIALVGDDAGEIAQRLARLMRSVASAGPIWWESSPELLQVMLRLQPAPTLTALFNGTMAERESAIGLFEHVVGGGHPAASLDTAAMLSWCEAGSRARRYAFALKIVPVLEAISMPGSARLTSQSRALLVHSPFPKAALKRLVDRMYPSVWSGSRAAIMEVNATALDEVLDLRDADFRAFAKGVKAQLLADISADREDETRRERARDERFE